MIFNGRGNPLWLPFMKCGREMPAKRVSTGAYPYGFYDSAGVTLHVKFNLIGYDNNLIEKTTCLC